MCEFIIFNIIYFYEFIAIELRDRNREKRKKKLNGMKVNFLGVCG